jgi:magnesium transporter
MEPTTQEYVERVRALLEAGDSDALAAFLAEVHPADIADVAQELDGEEQVAVLKLLDTERAAEVLTEIDRHSGQALLQLLTARDVVSLLGEMPSDDAADFMSTLPPETTERVEALMPEAEREQLQELMEFDEESAGGIMAVEYVAVPEAATIRDAIHMARDRADDIEDLQKIFVVDGTGVLVGDLGVLDLIVNSRSLPVSEVMNRNVLSVPVDMDQEEVAMLFGKYDVLTLPVIDALGRLVGRITVDDIIDVMEEEASEDIAYIAGTSEEELGEPSVFKVSRTRLPWLITGLVGQICAALVMSRHEASLRTYVVLAFFVPLIVGTAGAIGIQAAVVVVREIALGQIDIKRMGRRLMKELQVAALNGMALGVVLFFIVLAWLHEPGLGLLLWSSLMIVIFVAAFIGASVPLLFQRWRIDPAIATGPFIAVVNDVIGLTIYLSMARAYLSRLL